MSPEEDMLFCEAQKIFGNRLTEIPKVFSGSSLPRIPCLPIYNMASVDSSNISTINSLQQNQNGVTLMLMVLRQGSILQSTQSSRTVRKVIFIDEKDTMICRVIFANTMQLFQDQLKTNKTYIISNPTIRETNRSFPNVNEQIELVLQTNTTITSIEKTFSFSCLTFIFTQFCGLPTNSKDRQLDVIGITIKVKQSIQFKRPDKSIGYRREIILMNTQMDTIAINLWDDVAMNEGQWLQKIVNKKPILAFKT